MVVSFSSEYKNNSRTVLIMPVESAPDPAKGSPPIMRSVMSSFRFEHLLAGVAGGVTSTLILHPLDLIKIRFAGKLCHIVKMFLDCWLI